jgi:DNA-binding XRE family transcriptional regulator
MAKKGRLNRDELLQKQELAKLIYITEDVTQKELAERVDVTEKTVSKWIEDEGWSKLKRNIPLTRDELLASWYDELAELKAHIQNKPAGQKFADFKEAQLRRSLLKDIATLEQDSGIPEIISVMTSFVKFIRRNDLENAKEVSHIADAFIKSKIRG